MTSISLRLTDLEEYQAKAVCHPLIVVKEINSGMN